MSVITIGAWFVIAYACFLVAVVLCLAWDQSIKRRDERQARIDAPRFECVGEEAEAWLRGRVR